MKVMTKKCMLIMMAWLSLSGAYGQVEIRGTTIDKKHGSAVPYVNIGIRGTATGTASFETGEFRISIPNEHINDSLTFSTIGYKAVIMPIRQFSTDKQVVIKLEEDVIMLREVVVSYSRKASDIKWGLSGKSNSAMQFSSSEGGAAMALLVNENNKKVALEMATIDISRNELPEFKLRCRIMDVENGKPGKDLLQQNVVISSNIKEGLVPVDLSPFNLVLDRPFFVVFEWVLDKATSDYYKNLKENRPAWWPKGASVYNGKTLVIFDDQHKIAKKIPMTKEQQEEYERIRQRQTEFSTKKSKLKCFVRNSSMDEWTETERDMVCEVKGMEVSKTGN
jgi:hypothetical protein